MHLVGFIVRIYYNARLPECHITFFVRVIVFFSSSSVQSSLKLTVITVSILD